MEALTFRPRVPVFDANIRVGNGHNEIAPFQDRTALLAEMDTHSVERALIYHAQTEIISPVDGNCQLVEWLGGSASHETFECGRRSLENPRLTPQWSVMPANDAVVQIRALHAEGRVRSVRLHNTRTAGLPFRPWAYDELLSWLSQEGIPLWIPLPDADAHELMTTLQTYPHLVTVLVGAHYTHTLWVRPLLAALPNAYLELSRYETLGEVEALRDEFGAERLLYGSWYPRYAMGPMLFYLHHTDLSKTELTLVCSANLERILCGGGRND